MTPDQTEAKVTELLAIDDPLDPRLRQPMPHEVIERLKAYRDLVRERLNKKRLVSSSDGRAPDC